MTVEQLQKAPGISRGSRDWWTDNDGKKRSILPITTCAIEEQSPAGALVGSLLLRGE
jgi:hypothetical protein